MTVLQPTLHVNHPLIQFTGCITFSLLRTAALVSRFYRHRIQIWAIKAASHFARWILRFHMQYAIDIGSNSNFQVSQGSVATHNVFRNWDWKILKIGLHLPKLWSKVKCCFLRHCNIIKHTNCSIFAESLVNISLGIPVKAMQTCIFS